MSVNPSSEKHDGDESNYLRKNDQELNAILADRAAIHKASMYITHVEMAIWRYNDLRNRVPSVDSLEYKSRNALYDLRAIYHDRSVSLKRLYDEKKRKRDEL